MRICIMFALLFAATVVVFGEKDASLEELKSRAATAPINAQPALCTEIAERQLKAADQLYSSGDVTAATAAVSDIVTYSTQAALAANESGKGLKPTEIALRKMADRLLTIRHTLAFEDQKPVEDAANRLEALRSELLARMFAKGKKQ